MQADKPGTVDDIIMVDKVSVSVAVIVAVGVNDDGRREALSIDNVPSRRERGKWQRQRKRLRFR